MSRNVNPRPQFLDSAGDPLGLGKMYYFDSDTDTAKVTYADVNQTIANTHPVVLTADGRLPNVFFSGSARQKLTDSDDVQLWDIDPVGADDIGANFDDWNPLIIYDANDIVQGSDDNFYISINAGNQNNDPTSTPSEWAQIEFINIWNVNVTYQVGNTVKGSDNLFYVSLTANNLGNDPVGDVVNWGPPFVGVGSVVAGTGITVDATDPNNPIVAAINNGDVVGPASSVNNEIVLFSGATGKLLKAGPVTGTASGNVPLVGTKSSTETLAGLVEKSDSGENIAGTDNTVWPTVAGAKEIVDTWALRQASNLSDVASAATSFTNIKQAASITATGVVEIATQTEVNTGTDTARSITPETLDAFVNGKTDTVITASDEIVFADATDSNKSKKDTVQGILDLITSGGLVLIDTEEASTSASVVLTGIDGTYDMYAFTVSDAIVSVDNVEMWIRFGDSVGIDSGASDYDWKTGAPGTASLGNSSSAAQIEIADSAGIAGIGNAAGEGFMCSGKIDYSSGTKFPSVVGETSYMNNAGVTVAAVFSGHRKSAIALTQIELRPGSGTITSGRFTLWGMNHA